ncbi:MAG: hypothetical protein MJZ65_02065 [Paludibacteraceae bacterium]|nr:hypothetical protein [Paludibacteraceae bacterium]
MKKTMLMVAAAFISCMTSAWAQDLTQTTATCGQTVTITATPDAGYKFLYWEDDHNNTNPVREVEVNADMELTTNYEAVFTAASYTVVAVAAETEMGTVTGGGSYDFGQEVKLTAVPASKCYQFKQWSDGVTTAERTITVAANDTDNTYTAIFEEAEFTVKASTAGNGSVTVAKK